MTLQLQTELEITCGGAPVLLRGDGTIWIPEQNCLLVADLHLGKDASFRAAGIPVPVGLSTTTLTALSQSLQSTGAAELIFLGDLIHDRQSMTPALVDEFFVWRQKHLDIQLTLVRGNHDRHVAAFPPEWQMKVCQLLQCGPFELIHEVSEKSLSQSDRFQIGGHWHPVISIGSGADQMRLPCFVVGAQHITLPAFGPFKGGMKQARQANHAYYPICEGQIFS